MTASDAVGGSTHERRDHLDQVLGLLWPPPAGVSSCGRRPVAAGRQYLLLPNGHRPSVMVPRRPRAVTAAAIRHYKASAAPGARARFRALSWAARLGVVELVPDQVSIRTDEPRGGGIDGYLSDTLGTELFVSVYLGAPRANRKPVLQLLDRDGRLMGFAKVGVNRLTDLLVGHEAAALAFLAEHRLERLVVPEVLHAGTWNQHPVLVQRALPGGWFGSAQVLTAAMLEVARIDSTCPMPAATSPYWLRLRERVSGLPQDPLSIRLAHLLDVLDERAHACQVRLGSWHGDWTPWNMSRIRDRAAVWDWERFESGVPWGFDALHHSLQGAIVRRGDDPRAAVEALIDRAPALLGPFGIGAAGARFTALTYLVEIGTRYLHDDLRGAGGRLGNLDRWLLPVLVEHLHRRQSV